MKISNDNSDNLTIEKDSLIKFLNCFDENSNPFLPLFTDWLEVDLWLKNRDKNTKGLIMNTFEAFEFAENDDIYNGIVINPASNSWTMSKEQLQNFLEDYRK